MRQSVQPRELAPWEMRIVETCRECVRREVESRKDTEPCCTRCERLAARALLLAATAIVVKVLFVVCCALFGWR